MHKLLLALFVGVAANRASKSLCMVARIPNKGWENANQNLARRRGRRPPFRASRAKRPAWRLDPRSEVLQSGGPAQNSRPPPFQLRSGRRAAFRTVPVPAPSAARRPAPNPCASSPIAAFGRPQRSGTPGCDRTQLRGRLRHGDRPARLLRTACRQPRPGRWSGPRRRGTLPSPRRDGRHADPCPEHQGRRTARPSSPASRAAPCRRLFLF